MKRRLFAAFMALVSSVSLVAHEESVPKSWYQLPEDHPNAVAESRESERAQEKKAAEGVERILRGSSLALDKVWDEEERRGMSRGDWQFAALALDLSLSASGLIGAMMAKGEASAQIYWRKQKEEEGGGRAVFPEDEKVDLKVSGDWSRAEVARKIEPIIKAVMATKEVKDEPAFRKNLLETVLSYQYLLQGMAFEPGREWYVSKLRLDVSVDVSGRVHPTVTIGGNIRLRFEWEPATKARKLMARNDKNTENLKRFVNTIGRELQDLPFESLSPKGFDLKQLKFGLGIYGEGKFGVVKVGATVMGHMYLARRTVTHPVFIPEEDLDDSVALIDGQPEDRHLEYAKAIGVRYTTTTSRDGKREAVYSIPRERFKKGLEKAAKIGAWLAERSERSKGSRWEVYQVKTEFALSLGGTVGIVSLGGTAALELNFQKQSYTL